MKKRFAVEPTLRRGRIGILGFGTVGVRDAIRYLARMKSAGRADEVGPIYVGDLDQRTRDEFLCQVDEIYHGRPVFFEHPEFERGFGSRTPDEVNEDDVRGLWSPNLIAALKAWGLKYQRCSGNLSFPAEIIVFGSLGSHATPMIEGLAWLRAQHPKAVITLCLAIPADQHRTFARMLIEKSRATGVDDIILRDDAAAADGNKAVAVDDIGNDEALAIGLVGIDAGFDINNLQLVAGNNVAASLCPGMRRQQGHIAIYETYHESAAAEAFFTDPRLGSRFSAREDGLQSLVLRGRSQLRKGAGASSIGFTLEGTHPDAASPLVVACNVETASLQAVAQKVKASLLHMGQMELRHPIIFLPTREAYPALPSEAAVDIVLVTMQPVVDSTALLGRIFGGQADGAQRVQQPSPTVASPAMEDTVPLVHDGSATPATEGDPLFEVVMASVVGSNGQHR